MKTLLTSSITLALGLAAGTWFSTQATTNTTSAELEVLYWVAPMDANYRRDKPGQSPMGMDLVPVYAEQTQNTTAQEPLYWVAPMDANYRRDKPGQSPMGMDLIPVYKDASTENDAGLVTISSRVENNLGVRTQTAQRRPFVTQINTVGMLEFNQNSLWQINSRVSGWVDKLYINNTGEFVTKGQPLLTLYSPELIKAQEELLNTLSIGNKTLITSAKHRLSALGINQTQIKQLTRTKKVIQNVTISAPESGYITELAIREGAYITPSAQIIEAGLLTEIWLQAEIFESQADQVQVGDKAKMQVDSFPGKIWLGEVDYIYPELNAATRTLKVRIKIANPDEQLKPNMFATLTLSSQQQTSVIQVPREAIIRSGTLDRIVLAKGNGQYQSIKITLGRESAGYVEVLAGLKDGDNVVTSAQFLLDSESSLTADFSRIGPPTTSSKNGMAMDHSSMNMDSMDDNAMSKKTKPAIEDDLAWLDFDDAGEL
ncbi:MULTISPECIES: efflux RND transporter periplasmic adaptor subunit [unclassified Moritella]|uniref:efflux RND transporter periplasmic adaptor subunit n=1 Tax=unclassified Moritella TaxID=2637987 RepID=UPI001BA8F0DB|nr:MULTISPECIES: efflux RND transporter periplasmic adaptor subunit [unclassified Moritella]QUM87017.1 efflux RND transporter periplasmic adaptor subunit [Moritella sp. 28]QUM91253.1 efflux RND transporter periplasmic adaptor subunit [Moritella sp. 36]